MKRLYYLFRGTQYAKDINQDLLENGIHQHQLHFFSKDIAGLSSINMEQYMNQDQAIPAQSNQHLISHGPLISVGVGILFSLCMFMVMATSQPLSLELFVMVCTIFSVFGAWAGAMKVISNNNPTALFHDALEQGDTLLMLDAFDEQQECTAKRVMHRRHFEASFEGEENNCKALP